LDVFEEIIVFSYFQSFNKRFFVFLPPIPVYFPCKSIHINLQCQAFQGLVGIFPCEDIKVFNDFMTFMQKTIAGLAKKVLIYFCEKLMEITGTTSCRISQR